VTKVTLAEALLSKLSSLGVDNIFTVPGGGAMYLIDALVKNEALNGISCHHEQTAAIAAEYSSRLSTKSKFGVCIVTSGPGATNAITGLVGAWLESIPVLFISGQAKSTDLIGDSGVRQIGVQEVDIISMIKTSTKYAKTWLPNSDFAHELQTAIDQMLSGRNGPVWIDMPLDVQSKLVSSNLFDQVNDDVSGEQFSEAIDCSAVLDLLTKSQRPLLYLGHGVKLGNAEKKAIELIERLSIPFVTTWNAADILPYDHPLNMGRPGVVAERFSNFALQNCDLLLSIGSRLNNVLTAYNPSKFAKSAQKVVIDIDPNELALNSIPNALKINTGANQFLTEMLNRDLKISDISNWISKLQSWKNRYSLLNESYINNDALSHYEAVIALSKSIPENRIIVTGSSGLSVEAFYVAFRNKLDQRLLHTSALGSMGYAVPASIGAVCETGADATYCIEGDGSLQMNLQDLITLKNKSKKTCVIIFNNQGYASIRATQRGYFESRYFGTGPEGGNSLIKMKDIAITFGFKYVKASDATSLTSAINRFEAQDESVLLDVILEKDVSLFPKSSVYFDADGTMHSMPLEDMTPLIDFSELKNEMFFTPEDVSLKARENVI